MKYELKKLPFFSVSGMEHKLTNRKKENLDRCLAFWPYFNRQLKINDLSHKKRKLDNICVYEAPRRTARLFLRDSLP